MSDGRFVYRGRFGIIAAIRRALTPPPAPTEAQPHPADETVTTPEIVAEPVPQPGSVDQTRDLKGAYIAHVEMVKGIMSHEEAMQTAIGGGFDEIGRIETALLQTYGLEEDGYVIDVGCGSGRLAKPLSGYLKGTYLGIDLVPDLLEHARKITGRPDWRFEQIDHIGIPEADGRADMVVFF